MTDRQRKQAVQRIHAKRAFLSHLAVYVVMSVFFVGLWFQTGAGYFWPIWPILGWGIGVASHGVATYGGMRPITEEQIQREIARFN